MMQERSDSFHNVFRSESKRKLSLKESHNDPRIPFRNWKTVIFFTKPQRSIILMNNNIS